MIISHKHKYIFIHIPKAAGTSITQALYPFSSSYDLFLGCGCGEETLTKKDGFSLHKHSSAQDVKTYTTEERWREYFIFTRDCRDSCRRRRRRVSFSVSLSPSASVRFAVFFSLWFSGKVEEKVCA